jgi:glycosyltransferase involved in cell wall biosynthesis
VPDNLFKKQGKLHILISGTLPPPMGGMASYYQTLLDSSLSERVELCYVQTSSQKRQLSSSGRATLSNFVYAIRDCGRFIWALISSRPQIAHIGTAAGLSFLKNSFCVISAKFFGAQVLLHPHCSLLVLYHDRSKWWQWHFRQVVNHIDGIVVLSKEWLQLSSIIPGCQIYYLPNAIDLKAYQYVAKKNLAQMKRERPFKVLYLGYLGKAKGSFDILNAALEIQSKGINMIFDLVGPELTFGELGLLNEKIEQANLRDIVRIHAPAYGTDKLDFLNQADIFIYPSYYEGMPIAVIEAMACGLPIVASRVGGLPDLIQEGVNGFLIEPGKPEQLALALNKLTNDDKLRVSMGRAGFQLANNQYDIEKHVTQLISIYEKVLSNHR